MSVKRSQSGSRVLTVLETIASHQPIGVRALARLLEEDKSAIQRALMTLAHAGWIRATREPPARWEVTAHILTVAHAAMGSNDLRRRARPILDQLRDDSGETVLLTVPDIRSFVVVDVIESRQMLRMVPPPGTVVCAHNTATGRATLPFMGSERQAELLGAAPTEALLESFELTKQRGYAVSVGEINIAATNIAAPIFDFEGQIAGAAVICAPKERLTEANLEPIAKMVVRAAQEISQGPGIRTGLATTGR